MIGSYYMYCNTGRVEIGVHEIHYFCRALGKSTLPPNTACHHLLLPIHPLCHCLSNQVMCLCVMIEMIPLVHWCELDWVDNVTSFHRFHTTFQFGIFGQVGSGSLREHYINSTTVSIESTAITFDSIHNVGTIPTSGRVSSLAIVSPTFKS